MSGKIITDLGTWKSIAQWVDAYTATMDVSFEAAMNPEINGEVLDSLKHAMSEVKRPGISAEAKRQAQYVLANQQRIVSQMKSFTPEARTELLGYWKLAMREILAHSWDPNQLVQFQIEEDHVDKPLRFFQGDDPSKNYMILPRKEGTMAIKFWKFVDANVKSFDPREYTKRMLMKQGITQENFHLHTDKLAISNPWDPIP